MIEEGISHLDPSFRPVSFPAHLSELIQKCAILLNTFRQLVVSSLAELYMSNGRIVVAFFKKEVILFIYCHSNLGTLIAILFFS